MNLDFFLYMLVEWHAVYSDMPHSFLFNICHLLSSNLVDDTKFMGLPQ